MLEEMSLWWQHLSSWLNCHYELLLWQTAWIQIHFQPHPYVSVYALPRCLLAICSVYTMPNSQVKSKTKNAVSISKHPDVWQQISKISGLMTKCLTFHLALWDHIIVTIVWVLRSKNTQNFVKNQLFSPTVLEDLCLEKVQMTFNAIYVGLIESIQGNKSKVSSKYVYIR